MLYAKLLSQRARLIVPESTVAGVIEVAREARHQRAPQSRENDRQRFR